MIHLKYGNTNTFFVQGTKDNILVDTDWAGTMPQFYREIKRHPIKIDDIAYVMATHYHPDHMGLIGELMGRGIKLLLLDVQKPFAHYSDAIFARNKRLEYLPICEEKAIHISCYESRSFLRSLGIGGEMISTPSHSEDSISLLLDDGDCIVGDLEPIGNLEGYGENEMLRRDWEKIMKHQPKIIYFGHCNAMKIDQGSK